MHDDAWSDFGTHLAFLRGKGINQKADWGHFKAKEVFNHVWWIGNAHYLRNYFFDVRLACLDRRQRLQVKENPHRHFASSDGTGSFRLLVCRCRGCGDICGLQGTWKGVRAAESCDPGKENPGPGFGEKLTPLLQRLCTYWKCRNAPLMKRGLRHLYVFLNSGI